MKTPESLETLVDYGIIQEVVRPLMSGKEAQVFVVRADGVECVAKVYKEANNRTFKHRTEYTEGRKTRNTRDQRAINKRTRHGKKQDEAAWRNAEVDTLYRVRDGGVRVPEPINFVDGVLVMELVRDAEGDAAPRLGDREFSASEAYDIYKKLIREVVRMLCAGTIHGDLSEFNVLMSADGPVVIDFPQSVDPSKNQSARKLLLRDVENLHRFLARHAPDQPIKPLGEEMWALYEKNRLSASTELLGDYVAPEGKTDVTEVMALIEDANQDELMRRDARGDDTPLVAPPPVRRVVDFTQENKRKAPAKAPAKARSGARGTDRPPRRSAGEAASPPASPTKTRRPRRGPPKEAREEDRGKSASRSRARPTRSRTGAETERPKRSRVGEPPSGPAALSRPVGTSQAPAKPRTRRRRSKRNGPSQDRDQDKKNQGSGRGDAQSPRPPRGPKSTTQPNAREDSSRSRRSRTNAPGKTRENEPASPKNPDARPPKSRRPRRRPRAPERS